MSAPVLTLGLFDNSGTLIRTFQVAFNKFDLDTTPGTGQDDTAGYAAGSLVADRVAHKVYVCTNNATGAATWVELVTGGGSSPLTTKGDIYVFSTVDTRLPVGTNGQVLTADSGQATGLNWVSPGGSSGIGTVSGTGTDNHIARWDGTSNIQDSNIVVADTTGALSNTASLVGNLLYMENTGGPSANAIKGYSSSATGINVGIIGAVASTDNAAYGGSFTRGGTSNVGMFAYGLDILEMAAPATPNSGRGRLYVSSADTKLYFITSGGVTYGPLNSGTVTSVSGSGGTTGLTLTGGAITTTGTLTIGGTLIVANGGTGATTLTNHGILLGQGTSAIAATAVMTNGQLLVGQTGADPLPKTVSGDATMAATGALTVATVGGKTAIVSDGSVAFAANESMGGFKLTSLGNATTATDAMNMAMVYGASAYTYTQGGF